ncbi:MAG: thiamine phosphate synthase [Candidatus Aminicenantaceae bacterium]
MINIDWRLCVIADVEAAGGRSLPSMVKESVSTGATLVQFRAKSLDTADFLNLSCQIKKVARKYDVPLIINDRVDIALACDASGVHLGQRDLPLKAARTLLGKKRIIGISVSSVEEARAAEAQGADYLGVGPIYYTASKRDLPMIVGIEGLKAIKAKVKIPLLAIGGITIERALEVAASGADGMAVISAVWGADDISGATKALIAAFGARISP